MYATLAQLKAYLAITANTDDALLSDLLMRATSVIEQMTRKVFIATPAAPRRFGRGQMMWDGSLKWDYLLLPSGYYIAQLTGATDGDGNTIPLGEIELPPDGPPYSVLIRRGARWCSSAQTAEITARWGYSISPPADIAARDNSPRCLDVPPARNGQRSRPSDRCRRRVGAVAVGDTG
jgi:hypothetical protein